ncbi:MAG: glycoside hydrolase [Kiritimatiellae bacterium]|nr:glycoside hydrolase [Kiritimatiellia bacterium]
MKKYVLAVMVASASAAPCEESCGAPRVQERAEIVWTKAICKEPGRYIGWPTVCKAGNGDLLAVFSGDRDEHICPFGKVQMVRSADGGMTWSGPENVCNTIIDDRDAGIVATDDGTLVMSWFTSIEYRGYIPPRSKLSPGSPKFYWRLQDEKLPWPEVKKQLGAFTRRSTDCGRTWEAPVRTPCSAPHGPVQLKDGRLLYVGKSGDVDRSDLGKGVGKIVATESTDKGRSWRVIGEIPFPEQINVLRECHEPHAVEMSDGRIVALTRCHHKGDGFLGSVQSESLDGGKTWTEARPVGLYGFPPHLTRLADGRLLAVYCRRWGEVGEFACLSDDGGRTWDTKNEIKLAGHWNDDLGYPASVQMADGSILTVYYQAENKGEKTCLMGTLWRVTK